MYRLSIGFITLLAILTAPVQAQNSVPIEGMQYNVEHGFDDNLQTLTDKRVYIILKSGTQLSGRLKATGPALLHLEQLEGKEYFDALIRLDDISAVYTRFRQRKR